MKVGLWKISGILIGMISIFLIVLPVKAQELSFESYDSSAGQEGTDSEDSVSEESGQSVGDIQEEMLNGYDFQELNEILDATWNQSDFTFETLVSSLLSGDVDSSELNWKDYFYQIFLEEIDANRTVLVKMILLAMITAFFTNLSGSFGKGLISENGYFITYLIMTSLFLYSFSLMFRLAEDTVTDMIQIMEALIPTYIMAISVSSGVTSSAVLQEGMVMGITAVSWGIQTIVFPLIQLFVVLGLVNNLMEDDYFSKFGELIKTGTGWIMKSVLAFVVGLNAVKSMLAPTVDSVTTAALQRGLTIIPGGQAINTVSGVMIGSGILIKNAIGVGGMLVLVLAVSVPVLKMSIFVLSYKFLAALLQPISDKRMLRGIQSISEGGQMLITAVLTVITLFLLTIAIVAVSTNVTYYVG